MDIDTWKFMRRLRGYLVEPCTCSDGTERCPFCRGLGCGNCHGIYGEDTGRVTCSRCEGRRLIAEREERE